MNIFIVFLIAIFSFVPKSFAHGNDRKVIRAEAFQACVDDCLAFEEPGYQLKACIENCKDRYGIDAIINEPLYCNTNEEDCERDDDSEI